MRKIFLIEIISKNNLRELNIPVFLNPWDEKIFKKIKKYLDEVNKKRISNNIEIQEIYEELNGILNKQEQREREFLKNCGFLPFKKRRFTKYNPKYKEEIENEFYLLIKILREDDNISLYYTTKRKRLINKREDKNDGRNSNSLIYQDLITNERIDFSRFITVIEQNFLRKKSFKQEYEDIVERKISRYRLLAMLLINDLEKKLIKIGIKKSLHALVEDIIDERKEEKNKNSLANYLNKKILDLESLVYMLILSNKTNLERIILIFSDKQFIQKLLNKAKDIEYKIIEKSNELAPEKIFEENKEKFEKKYSVKYKKFDFEEFYKKARESLLNNQIEEYINSIKNYEECLLIEKSPEGFVKKYLAESLIIFLKKEIIKNNLEYELENLKKLKINSSNNTKLKENLKNFEELEKNKELQILKTDIFKERIKKVEIKESTEGHITEDITYNLNSHNIRNSIYKEDVEEYNKVLKEFYNSLGEYVDFNKIIKMKKLYLKLFKKFFMVVFSYEAFNCVLDLLIDELLEKTDGVDIIKI